MAAMEDGHRGRRPGDWLARTPLWWLAGARAPPLPRVAMLGLRRVRAESMRLEMEEKRGRGDNGVTEVRGGTRPVSDRNFTEL